MRQTGFCKTPWALKEGAPRAIFRPETAEERDRVFKDRLQKVIDSFGYPAYSCDLPPYEEAKLKDGTVKLKKRKERPKQIVFNYGDEEEAWVLFWQSLPS
jgi:hypothetical protein